MGQKRGARVQTQEHVQGGCAYSVPTAMFPRPQFGEQGVSQGGFLICF